MLCSIFMIQLSSIFVYNIIVRFSVNSTSNFDDFAIVNDNLLLSHTQFFARCELDICKDSDLLNSVDSPGLSLCFLIHSLECPKYLLVPITP